MNAKSSKIDYYYFVLISNLPTKKKELGYLTNKQKIFEEELKYLKNIFTLITFLNKKYFLKNKHKV